MPEKEAKELETKVEEAFVKEDAPVHSSFATEKDLKKGEAFKKVKPSAEEIFLYMSFKLKCIDEKLAILVGDAGKKEEATTPNKPEPPKKVVEKDSVKFVKPKVEPPTPNQDNEATKALKMMFPKELEDMLIFEDKKSYIKVKPRQYLGSDNFAKIASTIREAGGEYISAGRDSHFRIPK